MYETQDWSDVYGETPFNADRMKHIEEGIYENSIKLKGIKGYSNSNLNSVKITSLTGYGNVFIFSAMFVCIIQFQGNSVNIIDIYGTHGEMTTAISNNVVTLSGLYNWDHYSFIASSDILNIEKLN